MLCLLKLKVILVYFLKFIFDLFKNQKFNVQIMIFYVFLQIYQIIPFQVWHLYMDLLPIIYFMFIHHQKFNRMHKKYHYITNQFNLSFLPLPSMLSFNQLLLKIYNQLKFKCDKKYLMFLYILMEHKHCKIINIQNLYNTLLFQFS